jgi:hypothetical protein
MKKFLIFSVSCALLALSSVKPAAAQQVCSGYTCGMQGASDGRETAKDYCGNPDGRARLSEDYWFRAEQARDQGRWDDYAYLSAFSDALTNAECPYYYGARVSKTKLLALASKKASVAAK